MLDSNVNRKHYDIIDRIEVLENLMRRVGYRDPSAGAGFQLLPDGTPHAPGGVSLGVPTTRVFDPVLGLPPPSNLVVTTGSAIGNVVIDVTWDASTGYGADQVAGYVVEALRDGTTIPIHMTAWGVTHARFPQVLPLTGYTISVSAVSRTNLTSTTISGSITTGRDTTAIGGGNVLRNSSFEDASNGMVNWSPQGDRSTAGHVSISSTEYRGVFGTHSVKFEGDGNFYVQQDANLTVGTWVLSCWVKGDSIASISGTPNGAAISGEAITGSIANVEILEGAASGVTAVAGMGTFGWTHLALRFDVTTATAQYRIYLARGSSGVVSGTAWFDDVQLEMGNTVTGYSPRADELLSGVVTTPTIADFAVTNAKINDLIVNKLTAGTLNASVILGSVVATGGTGTTHVEIRSDAADRVLFKTGDSAEVDNGYIYSGQVGSGASRAWTLQLAAPIVNAGSLGATPYLQLRAKSVDGTINQNAILSDGQNNYVSVDSGGSYLVASPLYYAGAVGTTVYLSAGLGNYAEVTPTEHNHWLATYSAWFNTIHNGQVTFRVRGSGGYSDARFPNLPPSSSDPLMRYALSSGQIFRDSSTAKYKHNIRDWSEAFDLNDIDKLSPIAYEEKDFNTKEMKPHSFFGLLAEALHEVYPSLVVLGANGDPEGILYDKIPVLLLEAILDLRKRVVYLEGKND